MYSDLAEVLDTDFAGGNKVLTELSDFYASCIASQLMNETEFVDNLLPVIRKLYQDLGTFSYWLICGHLPQRPFIPGGWSLVGIPGDGTQWSVNSSQFIREKMVGNEAFYSLSVGLDEDAKLFTLEVSCTGYNSVIISGVIKLKNIHHSFFLVS